MSEFQAAFAELPGVDVDPKAALLRELQHCAGVTAWLRSVIAGMEPEQVAARMTKLPATVALGEWVDRTGKLANYACRIGLDQQAIAAAELHASTMVAMVAAALDSPDAGLTPAQRLTLRGLVAGQLLGGDEGGNEADE